MDRKTLLATIGVNEVPLLSKLLFKPYEEVWPEAKAAGLGSVEVCALIATNARAKACMDEQAKMYKWGFPKCFAFVDAVDHMDALEEIIYGAEKAGMKVYSCHLMGAEMYPEYLMECLPFVKAIHEKYGIANFVASCSITSVESAESFLPYLEQAGAAMAAEGITLCVHNHHMDSEKLENGKSAIEIIIENCPHVMLQFDTGWAWYGHQDPVQFIKDHSDRIASLHLKDVAVDARERKDDGRFTAIGYGAVPTKECLELIDMLDLKEGMLIIDQDASENDMYEDISKGIEFVKGCLLV